MGRSFKSLKLRGNAPRSVGVGEMLHQRNFIDLRQRVQAGPGSAKTIRRKTQPVHAGVHFQKHPVRQLRLVGCQPVDLLVAVNRVP